jgi:hypothetical protein
MSIFYRSLLSATAMQPVFVKSQRRIDRRSCTLYLLQPLHAGVAQLAEQLICNQQVVRSNRIAGLYLFFCVLGYNAVPHFGDTASVEGWPSG